MARRHLPHCVSSRRGICPTAAAFTHGRQVMRYLTAFFAQDRIEAMREWPPAQVANLVDANVLWKLPDPQRISQNAATDATHQVHPQVVLTCQNLRKSR